jgi:hypothetical protein
MMTKSLPAPDAFVNSISVIEGVDSNFAGNLQEGGKKLPHTVWESPAVKMAGVETDLREAGQCVDRPVRFHSLPLLFVPSVNEIPPANPAPQIGNRESTFPEEDCSTDASVPD